MKHEHNAYHKMKYRTERTSPTYHAAWKPEYQYKPFNQWNSQLACTNFVGKRVLHVVCTILEERNGWHRMWPSKHGSEHTWISSRLRFRYKYSSKPYEVGFVLRTTPCRKCCRSSYMRDMTARYGKGTATTGTCAAALSAGCRDRTAAASICSSSTAAVYDRIIGHTAASATINTSILRRKKKVCVYMIPYIRA